VLSSWTRRRISRCEDEARVWRRVDRSGGEDGCRLWRGGTCPGGYGKVICGGKRMNAAKRAYILVLMRNSKVFGDQPLGAVKIQILTSDQLQQ